MVRSSRSVRGAGGVLAVLACGSLVLSACSSSGKSAGSPGTGTEKAASGTTINVGSIGTFTVAQGAASNAPAKSALIAWADSVNAAGGLGGHKINLIVKDDQGSPATALAEARELVTQDHVVALVGDFSDFDAQWSPYIQKQGVPVVGSANQAALASNPNFFSEGPTQADFIGIAIKAAAAQGITKIAVPYCAEAPVCAQVSGAIKASGGNVVWSGAISSSAPSYTAPCLSAKSAGADGMFIAAVSQVDQRVAEACSTQGYKPVQVTGGSTVIDAWLKVPGFDNMVASSPTLPWFVTSVPAGKAFQAAMAKYQPGALLNGASSQAWAAGKLFEAAYKAAPPTKDMTSNQLRTGLYALKNETLGGLTAPLTFTKGKAGSTDCGFIFSIKDGHYVLPQGTKLTCV